MFRPPEPLNLEGNVSENWRLFKQKFENFMVATDLSDKEDKKKLAVFQNLLGDEALELFNSFDDAKKATLALVLAEFENYCAPKQNVIFERFLFNSIVQKEGQSFDSFLTELRKGIKNTKYKDPEDMIRDRIVIGSLSKEVQEKLILL